MTYTYRYTGDLPTVFIHLSKDGHGWMPNKNDTIDWPIRVDHPLLELVDGEYGTVADTVTESIPDEPVAEEIAIETEPATPDPYESPVAVDYLKEN